MPERESKGYNEIAGESLEILTSFFMESLEGEDNILMLDILTDQLGDDPTELEGEEQLIAFEDLTYRLTDLFSGMLVHVVNMIRILAMMGMRSDQAAYQNYVRYFHTLLPTFESMENEADLIEYVKSLHGYFGVEVDGEEWDV